MSEHVEFDFGMALDGDWIPSMKCRSCFAPWPCVGSQLAAAQAEVQALRGHLLRLTDAAERAVTDLLWLKVDGQVDGSLNIITKLDLVATGSREVLATAPQQPEQPARGTLAASDGQGAGVGRRLDCGWPVSASGHSIHCGPPAPDAGQKGDG